MSWVLPDWRCRQGHDVRSAPWYVDDVATSACFLQLYRVRDQGMQKADALRATRQAMSIGKVRLQGDKVIGSEGIPLLTELTPSQRRRMASRLVHPYFWAGVQLIGTPWRSLNNGFRSP